MGIPFFRLLFQITGFFRAIICHLLRQYKISSYQNSEFFLFNQQMILDNDTLYSILTKQKKVSNRVHIPC